MTQKKSKLAKVAASVLNKNLIVEANTTSSMILFQPKAPEKLNAYRRKR